MNAKSEKTSLKPIVTTAERPIDRLLDIMAYLRTSTDGCAWTKDQTHKSLTPYLIEESHETADTIDQGKTGDALRDELGDVLLQIVFHAEIARERKAFDFDGVAQAIVDKLERRYPTILGDEPNTLKTPEEIDRRWEEIKALERAKKGVTKEDSILDEISHGLPALVRSAKLKGRAAKAGWEWPDVSMLLDKISEEVGELRHEIEASDVDKRKVMAEFGDMMFMMVDFARFHGFDAEDALRETNNRFERRFRFMEQGLNASGKGLTNSSREERIHWWNEAKAAEKKAAQK
ncbi:MAG: nucleoside triphosphate pyrophosphohydrolase [Micavibrio sp.]|nr:nucleoside triphosphate pyrophosphohydrolase [Micavibrio sp.]